MQPNNTIVVIESQPDWLTMAVHSERKTQQLRAIAEDLELRELAEHNKSVPFRLSGYIGFRTGRVAYGERENAGLLQLSGDLARSEWDRVYPLRDSVTRLDLAVTTRLPGSCDALPADAYAQAAGYHDTHPNSALPLLIMDANGGASCNIGDRTSDFYLRYYNKQRECEARHDDDGAAHYHQCIRAELEVKGVAAPAVAKQLNDSHDRPHWAQQFVHDYLTAHGVCPPFPRPALRPSSAAFGAGATTRRGASGCKRACGLRLLGWFSTGHCRKCCQTWG